MNTFSFDVKLKIVVEAFEEQDALEIIRDEFGVGNSMGFDVLQFEVTKSD